MGPNQTYKLLHSKGNHKQTNKQTKNEKITYWMEESICKWRDQQGFNLQIIQRAHTTQQQQTKTTQLKNGQKP